MSWSVSSGNGTSVSSQDKAGVGSAEKAGVRASAAAVHAALAAFVARGAAQRRRSVPTNDEVRALAREVARQCAGVIGVGATKGSETAVETAARAVVRLLGAAKAKELDLHLRTPVVTVGKIVLKLVNFAPTFEPRSAAHRAAVDKAARKLAEELLVIIGYLDVLDEAVAAAAASGSSSSSVSVAAAAVTTVYEAVLVYERTDVIDGIRDVLDRGSNVDASDNDGNTALHHAVMEDYPEVVEALVGVGADVGRRNLDGMTPRAIATLLKHASCVAALTP